MAPLQIEPIHRPEEEYPIMEKSPTTIVPTFSVTTYENKGFDLEDQDTEDIQPMAGMRSLTRQALLGLMVYLGAIHGGVMVGYSNILLPQLNNSNSSLHADPDTASSIAGVYTIATPVGCLLCGVLMSYYGRKLTMQLGFLLFVPGWLLICFAHNHIMIFCGIVVAGLAKGLTAGAPIVLLDELADPKVRGVMCCLGFVFMSLGIFTVSFLGVHLSWQMVAGIGCVLAIVCLLTSFLVAESPVWLARNGRSKAAERALNWIWGPGKETEAKHDLDAIMKSIKSEEEERVSTNASNWRTFMSARVLKPFIIIHIFNLFQIICGTNLLIFFALTIMKQIESISGVGEVGGVDSETASVLISIVRVIFVIAACVLLFLTGRRQLALSSGVGTSVAALALGTYLYIQTTSPIEFVGTSWVAMGLILVFVAMNTIGFFVLPSVMMGEVLPAKIRSIACGYIYAINDVGMCFAIKGYPTMSESLGAHGLFWMFGIASIACTLLVFFLLPETQGWSLEQIEDYFASSNIIWQTRKRHQATPLVKRNSKVISS